MGELVELAARCEAATADEQREWLEQSFYALNPAPEEYGEPRIPWVRLSHRFHDLICAKAYLDAALTLVPEGYDCGFQRLGSFSHGWCQQRDDETDEAADFEGMNCATPALALCATALRARAAEMKG